tara:strand:+ start:707 stop:1540 length:834 start_codon:yes stop_codon:yes gene_type:complete
MSLEDRVKKFAEERRAMLEEQLAQENEADTAKVKWQGFNTDGHPVVKNGDKTETVEGQGFISNKKDKSMIYDDTGSVEYYKKKKSELSRYQKDQTKKKKPAVAKKKTASLIHSEVGNYAIAITSNVAIDVICIAVIDENNNRNTDADWAAFRAEYPLRRFFLLQPSTGFGTLYVPSAFSSDANATHQTVSIDPAVSDWYTIAGLDQEPLGAQCILFIDQSGSMTINTVGDSYDLFKQKCTDRGNKVAVVDNTSEDYIAPFYIENDYFRGIWTPEWPQ